jgi:hypothetical protein
LKKEDLERELQEKLDKFSIGLPSHIKMKFILDDDEEIEEFTYDESFITLHYRDEKANFSLKQHATAERFEEVLEKILAIYAKMISKSENKKEALEFVTPKNQVKPFLTPKEEFGLE